MARLVPYANHLGIEVQQADSDRVVCQMVVRPELTTANATVHGGAVMSLADYTGAIGGYLNLPEGATATTTSESKTNFISAAASGQKLTATATPVHIGRRTSVWQTRIEREDGRLVALVTQTQMVL
ncbi:MAG: PaaI family thioesterase [Gammaproteobacteria bacterium]